jgi:hypothetical protein
MKREFYELLRETTFLVRYGQKVEQSMYRGMQVTEVYAMPHADEVDKNECEVINLCLVGVAIIKDRARGIEEKFIKYLKDYPDPTRFKSGPSYIEIGAAIGSQDLAFQMIALGAYLKLWSVFTPLNVGVKGHDAINAARNGFVMMGYFDIEKPNENRDTETGSENIRT